MAWPAASTIGELFDREGLTIRRRLRRRAPPSSAPFAACGDANAVWCIDFKGWFLTGDGTHCEPLTLSDAYSRYLLRCQPLGRTDGEHVWPVHRPNNHSSRYEQNRKTVTHVVGQICYL